jgi:AhpD family alkylhydroperoxidase
MADIFYKKIYTVSEFYTTLQKGLRTLKYMVKNKKNHLLAPEFTERIMLAVTEVNGCEVCSYAHTKIALEQGMSNEEIGMILSGNTESIPAEEATAVCFAQHYADTKGNPSQAAWQQIVDFYGMTKALGILGAIRMMMIGNAYGIAISAFRSRLKGNAIEKTGLHYEITMISSIIIFLPLAFLHSLILDLMRTPLIDFKDGQLTA